MRIVTRLANTLAAMVMLLAPAPWNGFPLLQYDSGGYLARWYERTLEQSRSTISGLFPNALFVFIGFAAATHTATLAVLIALLGAGLLVACFNRSLVPWARLGYGASALALGAVMLVAANYVVAGRLAWTPGGIALAFGRMLNDGI